MFCVYIQNCASCRGGEHIFIKVMKKDGREMKKGSRESLEGRWNEYVRGLAGRETENVEKVLVLKAIFKGVGVNGWFVSGGLGVVAGPFWRRKNDVLE